MQEYPIPAERRGYYELSNGEIVKGLAAAKAAQAELDSVDLTVVDEPVEVAIPDAVAVSAAEAASEGTVSEMVEVEIRPGVVTAAPVVTGKNPHGRASRKMV